MTEATGESPGTSTPKELLAAWRAAERRYALAAAGTPDATAQHAEMRRLMDEYEWTIRGGVAPQVEAPRRRGQPPTRDR